MKGRREKMWLLSSCLSQCETLHVNPFTLFQNDQKSHLIQCERAKRAMHIVRKSPKMSHLHFTIMAFSTNFCLVTLFDRKLQGFKNSPKLTIFGIFNKLLSLKNVNLARFARNVEWDFFSDFQTPCSSQGWESSCLTLGIPRACSASMSIEKS